METKPLLFGIIGFLLGGLLVSVAATTFDKPQVGQSAMADHAAISLQNKTDTEFNKIFITR